MHRSRSLHHEKIAAMDRKVIHCKLTAEDGKCDRQFRKSDAVQKGMLKMQPFRSDIVQINENGVEICSVQVVSAVRPYWKAL